ncbi:Protein of unknown function (DUF3037) [Dyadobacter jejuensis]|uniref:DUF3037 family protein n=1 Tax=Dyadobacter jejuensis TaxID=1082580 RepID=A0A316B938_9BACT|nr:DUF3037 domain-containing protein [Dyadobacter jejuensis]PWJ59057.1 Protein of unknown function (DUF3037) [Dyadobacter jejuensis]
MPETSKFLYEYAVVRLVPCIEREEFINVGVILLCAGQRFLDTRIHLDPTRLKALKVQADPEELQTYLNSLQAIAKGEADSGPIGQQNLAQRFRWLTAHRSTVLQTSRVHPGFCLDASQTLNSLFEDLVL